MIFLGHNALKIIIKNKFTDSKFTKVHHLPNQRAIMNISQPNGYPSTSSQNKSPPAI